MASFGLKGSPDLGKLRINPEEDITGVGLEVGLSSLSKIMQCLGLTLLKVLPFLWDRFGGTVPR